MKNKITREKLEKYFKITEKALEKAKQNINKNREKEAKEIIQMVENYLSDARHFKGQGDRVDALASINYSHGWLDSGARLEIFDVKDDRLFVIK